MRINVLFWLVAWPAVALSSVADTPAQQLINQGNELLRADRPDEALKLFNQAIRLDPQSSIAYEGRGNVECLELNFSPALTDLTTAIRLDASKSARPYLDRCECKYRTGDFAGAEADANKAGELDPKEWRVDFHLSLVELQRGGLQSAMKYLDAATRLGGDPAVLLQAKAAVYYARGDWSEALAAYQAASSKSSSLVKNCYAHFFIWLIFARQNRTDQANQELSAFVAAAPGIWEYPWLGSICQFLLGNIGEADFFAAAQYPVHRYDLQRRTEVEYYSGMKRLLAGNQAGAISAFRRCVALGDFGIAERVFSNCELKRLGAE